MRSHSTLVDRRLRRSWAQRSLIVFNVIMIAGALFAAMTLRAGQASTETLSRVTLPGSVRPVSEQADPGNRVLNFLLVGTDSTAGLDPDDPILIGRKGEHFSDVIIVARLEEATSSLTLFSIPRDLWLPISDTNSENRINTAYGFGGPARLIDTIKDNMGIEIDYFVNIDFLGFQKLIEVIGGVDVYFPAPARDWDSTVNRSRTGFETLVAGCQFLDPVDALAYARSRHYQTMDADGVWVDDMTGDLGRIRRQQDFMRQLISKAIADGIRNPFVLRSLIGETMNALTVDDRLNGDLILDLATSFRSFEAADLNTYSYPTDFGFVGSKSVLFGRDDDAAPLLALLTGADENDPITVNVDLIGDPNAGPVIEGATEALLAGGFEPGISRTVASPYGIELRHGPDGTQAANLVLAQLETLDSTVPIVLVEDADLQGRTVEVVVGDSEPPTLDNDDPRSGSEEAGASAQAAVSEIASPAPEVPAPCG